VTLPAVGDEPRIAAFLANGLRAHGDDVERASTGREGAACTAYRGMQAAPLPAG
jgi:DNA-binding response OmpR family regulator